MLDIEVLSSQEFSLVMLNLGRQGDMFIFSEARLQDEKNRQNSISVEDKKLQQEWEWS